MRAWMAGAGVALLVGAASCGGKGKEGDHGQHGGAPSAAKEMSPMPAVPIHQKNQCGCFAAPVRSPAV